MEVNKKLGVLLWLGFCLFLCVISASTVQAEERRINTGVVAVVDRPVPVGGRTIANLTKDHIVRVLERKGLMTKIRTGKIIGWVPAFSLSIYDPKRYKKVEEQTESSEKVKSLTRRDANDMTSSAGALGVHELSKSLAAEGEFTDVDTAHVDTILAYQLKYPVDKFLQKGRLGKYMFAGGAQ